MNPAQRIAAWMPVLLLVLAVAGCSGNPRAIEQIKKLGGFATVDKESPDHAVIAVDLKQVDLLDADLECLEGLTKVQSLNLTRTATSDEGLEHLAGLVQLEILSLRQTKVTDLASIRRLTRLEDLNLWGTRVTNGGLAPVAGMSRLRSLNLSNCPLVTNAGLEYVQGLVQLTSLCLGYTQATDDGLTRTSRFDKAPIAGTRGDQDQ